MRRIKMHRAAKLTIVARYEVRAERNVCPAVDLQYAPPGDGPACLGVEEDWYPCASPNIPRLGLPLNSRR